jgi:hypothetical protein
MAKSDKKQGGAREPKEGFAFLQAPSNVTSCSWDGAEYPVDADGVVEVPAGGALALAEHGFVAL